MYLCIDTISELAGITILDKKKSVYLKINPKNASESIISTIDEALKSLKISLSDLEAVFIIKGPGSFTGLRVGLSVANQFAHQLKIPIFALRTDEWYLNRSQDKDIIYLQSMNRDEVYVANEEFQKIVPLSKILPSKYLGQLTNEHKNNLDDAFEELIDLFSVPETWACVIKKYSNKKVQKGGYNIIEPFYGKEAKITKSKKINIKGFI